MDGTVFDATEKGNPTVAFTNQFVKGFSEGLMLMKEGAKYRFFIPSELAYQHKSRGKDINKENLTEFINLMDVPSEDKKRLLKLTPKSYIGYAEKLARD